MTINKNIYRCFSLIVGFVIFQYITISAADLTLQEFEGEWFTIAMTDPNLTSNNLRCDRRKVTLDENSDTFNVNDYVYVNGTLHEFKGHGNIINSKTYIFYPELNSEDVNTIMTFNNNQDLILTDENNPNHTLLHSRKSTASKEVIAEFHEIADKAKLKVNYIPQDDCTRME